MFDYKIYTSTKGEKRVRFDNGEDYVIEKTDDGRECYAVPNPYAKGELKLFVNRIGDAVNAVKEGYGDEIRISSLFGGSESVLRYVDRDFGERMRKNSIAFYSDSSFLWGIKLGNKNSFESSFLLEDDTINSPLEAYARAKKLFQTKEQTKEHIAFLNQKVEELLNSYHNSDDKQKYYEEKIAPMVRQFHSVGISAWWSHKEPSHIFKSVQLIYHA